jgi:hypothetical protein
MDEHALHVAEQVLLRVRIITECMGRHTHSMASHVWLRRDYAAIIALREEGRVQHTSM